MAVRRVTRLDRQNDKHLKRHKRRAELTFTSVPILLSLPEKNAFRRTRTTSQQCLGISDFFWKFLLFFFLFGLLLQRKNQGSTVTGAAGATVGSRNVKNGNEPFIGFFFPPLSLSGSFISVHFETKSMLKMTVRFPEGAKYGNTPLDPLAFSIWSRVTHRSHLSSTGPFFIITGNENSHTRKTKQ